MLQGFLKQCCRLNRTMGFLLVVYGLVAFFPWDKHSQFSTLQMVGMGLYATLTLGFLGANEISLKLIKRFKEFDFLIVEKMSVLVPVFSFLFVGSAYLLCGQLSVYLLGAACTLQSQLYGHGRLTQGLVVCHILLFLGGLALHYPQPLPGDPVFQALTLLPVVWVFYQYGKIVESLVRTSSSQVMRLQSLAATDGLTGLINRRQFNHRLLSEIARARRHHVPLSLALFDLDDFKKINDFYGHPVGDRILKELGSLLANNVRESDIPARYGGEEFALILPETRQVEAFEILERLRGLIERTVFCLPDNPMTMTVSVGVAQMDLENHTSFELVEQADAALYEAKKQGKNKVVYGVVPTPKLTLPQLQRSKPLS